MPFAALVGEEIEGLVIAIEPGERGLLVSPRHLAARRFGRIAGRRRRVQGRVLYANGGGLVVDLGGRITGFVPRSELLPEHSAQHADLAGERWRGYVLEATRRSIVLTVSEPESTSRAGAIVSASIAKGAAPFRLAG
jgi:ribosomal protein S1